MAGAALPSRKIHLTLPYADGVKESRIVMLFIAVFTVVALAGMAAFVWFSSNINFSCWVGLGGCAVLALLSLLVFYVELHCQRERYQVRRRAFEKMMSE